MTANKKTHPQSPNSRVGLNPSEGVKQVSQKNRTWKDNAAEFAALDRGEGWQFAILVACSVYPTDVPGGRPTDTYRGSMESAGKCSIEHFARQAETSTVRVRRYYDAWQKASDNGWVQDAATLTPMAAHDMALPEMPWKASQGGVYDASKTGGQINNTDQIAAKAAKDPEYAKRVLDAVTTANVTAAQASIRESVARDPQIAGAADQGLEDRRQERLANVQPMSEKAATQRDEQGDLLDLVFNLRRVHRYLADVAGAAQNIPAGVKDQMAVSIREEIDWIRGVCDIVEVALNGGPLDQELRALLDAETGL